MADPRTHPRFWTVQTRLQQIFGTNLPLSELRATARGIARAHKLRLPRDVVRRKDLLIAWFAQHFQEFVEATERTSGGAAGPVRDVDARLRKNWTRVLELQKQFGHWKMEEILEFAMEQAAKLGIKLDREAKRNKNVLLCWIAEHSDEIQIQESGDGMTLRALDGSGCHPMDQDPADPMLDFFDWAVREFEIIEWE
jgi:hypothetical protein